MNASKIIQTFPSSNGCNTVTYYVYTPLEKPRAILQISHGMCEYLERYEDFISFLTAQNILVCGNDHIGHKGSTEPNHMLGFFSEEQGWKYLTNDLSILTNIIKTQYPDVPIFLYGHSMGSFLSRLYITKFYNSIDGVIISGTGGDNALVPIGVSFMKTVLKLKGPYHRSSTIQNLLFGTFNNHYENAKTQFDWLTRDEKVVQAYIQDPFCNFTFTTSAFLDLVKLLSLVSSDKCYDATPVSLPLFLMSGAMDPLGNYGKGVLEVYWQYRQHGMEHLDLKLYPGCRHELVNEQNKEQVYQDILKWIDKQLNQ